MERRNAWLSYTEEERKELFALSEDYKKFLSAAKTEREFVTESVKAAKKAGYQELGEVIRSGKKLSAGDRVYATWYGKTMAMFVIGTEPMAEGMNILGAHIDSPRLDLKQNPLYEDTDQALLDTHYYGGIKKYQWTAMPLALHGVIAKKDGTSVTVRIGEDPSDPVFMVSDLLPHLGAEQMKKKASEFIEGEDLNVLVGSEPLITGDETDEEKKDKEAVKANILRILEEQYGVEEEDFLSAEIEVVPAGPARDLGFDRSMVIGYGHDDRICAYTSLAAQLMVEHPNAPRSACW